MNAKIWKVSLVGVLLLFVNAAYADETAAKARAILAEHGAKVVTVQLLIKESSSYGDSEYTQDTFGTVISPDGLIVCSLLATDPSLMMEQMGYYGEGEMQLESKVAGVKVIMGDKLEKEAKVVLRDRDLDLAFLRLKETPAEPLPFVDLKASEKIETFEEVFSVTQLGKAAKRMPTLNFSRIMGKIEKPRLFYFVGGFTGEGEPVFSADSKLVGILVTRTISTGGDAYGDLDMTSVLIPGADVLEVALQAPMEEAPPLEIPEAEKVKKEKPAKEKAEAPAPEDKADGANE